MMIPLSSFRSMQCAWELSDQLTACPGTRLVSTGRVQDILWEMACMVRAFFDGMPSQSGAQDAHNIYALLTSAVSNHTKVIV